MKTYKLHLVRHGLTQANIDGIFVGGGMDIPLCQPGIDRLKELLGKYEYPNVPLLFSSPMVRAVETARLMFPDVRQHIVLGALREFRFGEFEGMQVSDMLGGGKFSDWLDPRSDYMPVGGESGEDFGTRTVFALQFMFEYMAKRGISEALCVSHGGVMMSMLGQKGIPRKPSPDWISDNGCGYTIQADAAMIMRDGMVEVTNILPNGYAGEYGHENRYKRK